MQTDINMSAKAQVRLRGRQRMHWRKGDDALPLLHPLTSRSSLSGRAFLPGVALQLYALGVTGKIAKVSSACRTSLMSFADDLLAGVSETPLLCRVDYDGVAVVALAKAR
ncbi:MAG: hypothetical protein IPM07_14335 [Anaerolineales bacterium]|nr:hypothetical protein [Anaerolineales bacterium]